MATDGELLAHQHMRLKSMEAEIKQSHAELTALREQLAAAEKKAKAWDGIIDMMEGLIEAGIDDDTPKNEHCNAYIAAWSKMKQRAEAAEQALAKIQGLLDCRAGKLLRKHKPFIVVANDEPYFTDVYLVIRETEKAKGQWTGECERQFQAATQYDHEGDYCPVTPELQAVLQQQREIADLRKRAEAAEAVVSVFPASAVQITCDLIEQADNEAMHADGPVPCTAAILSPEQLQQCLSALWACRKSAKAARKHEPGNDGTEDNFRPWIEQEAAHALLAAAEQFALHSPEIFTRPGHAGIVDAFREAIAKAKGETDATTPSD